MLSFPFDLSDGPAGLVGGTEDGTAEDVEAGEIDIVGRIVAEAEAVKKQQ